MPDRMRPSAAAAAATPALHAYAPATCLLCKHMPPEALTAAARAGQALPQLRSQQVGGGLCTSQPAMRAWMG